MRILFAWEMGKNYGHVTQIVDVARVLAARGAEIFIALQRPEAMHGFAEGLECRLLQAPYCPPGPPKQGEQRIVPLCYPDDLLPCGYDDPEKIAALVTCWQSLYELVWPDVLVAQAAPTALLAARGRGFKTAALGRSYDMPPLSSPMPPLRYWEDGDEDVVAEHEAYVLKNVNAALSSLNLPKLKKFRDMLETDASFLCTLGELDHYPARKNADYVGPFVKTDSGAKLDWNRGARKRILAYIRPGTASFAPAVNAMLRLPADHDVIVAAPGVAAETIEKSSKPNVRIVDGPVRLDRLMNGCDLAINHASAGICCALALAGVPMLMLPNHIEQMMFARAIGRAGLGRGLAGKPGEKDILQMIGHMLTQPQYGEKARALALKYRDFDPAALAERIAGEIAALAPGKNRDKKTGSKAAKKSRKGRNLPGQ